MGQLTHLKCVNICYPDFLIIKKFSKILSSAEDLSKDAALVNILVEFLLDSKNMESDNTSKCKLIL